MYTLEENMDIVQVRYFERLLFNYYFSVVKCKASEWVYLLFLELSLEDVCGVADVGHPLDPRLHPREPSVHLDPLPLVPLAVAEHRVQLRLPLEHLAVRLVPVLPQLAHCTARQRRGSDPTDSTPATLGRRSYLHASAVFSKRVQYTGHQIPKVVIPNAYTKVVCNTVSEEGAESSED